jgi:GntR family transcriptional regulator, transcriptional repressor for pyruvate dehydrogenase complex
MSEEIYDSIIHARTADEVVSRLELLILDGVLRVGDRLPGERDLAQRFEVSRPILREALKSLEERGLLSTRHGGGTFVADVIGTVFTGPIVDLIARHHKATIDYLEYRREVEGFTAEFAALRATADDRALLQRIVEAMAAAHDGEDFDEEARLDVEFHNAVGECAHNIVLLHTLRSCYRLLADGVFYNRAMIYALPGARAELLAQHRAIHDAIVAGDGAAAREAARTHIDYVARATQDAERTSGWLRVSRLRLQQRSDPMSARKKARAMQ